jgi:hypothetical protein
MRLLGALRPTGAPLARLRDVSEPHVAFEEKLAGVQGFGIEGWAAIGPSEVRVSRMNGYAADLLLGLAAC